MQIRHDKPNFLVYLAYLGLFAVALNTAYIVLPNDQMKWYLLGLLVIAVMSGIVISARYYMAIGLILDAASLAVFIYYAYKIYEDSGSFGTYLGEMLSVMLVLRTFKLFRYQDFLLPLIISLTLLIFSAIPSFSADFVYSLVAFLMMLGLALFLGSVDEFTRLPRKRVRHHTWKYTYDFLDEYVPIRTSKYRPIRLTGFLKPALKSIIPAVLMVWVLSSAFYFTVEHDRNPGQDNPILGSFGDTGFETDLERQNELLTGNRMAGTAQYYVGFDEEFNIAGGRLVENSVSHNVVMEVESNLPSYWRGKAFDTYTGRGWLQSDKTRNERWSLDPPSGQNADYHGEVANQVLSDAGIKPDPDILTETIRQTYHLMTDLPGILFTAYQPVEVSVPVPSVLIDDTFTIHTPTSSDSMVADQSYRVVSRKHFLQGPGLNAFDYSPTDLADSDPEFYKRYIMLPERGSMEDPKAGFNFTRIRAKAYEVTAGLDTVYQRVRALSSYLENNYHKSQNPPAAVPPEIDAVDYFLFDWEPRRGHCEYFSSSLAVLCRSIGIPARVASGYITGNYNLMKNRYIVQELHAHAWVEVYWPKIGWVEFDPTPQTWFMGATEKAASVWLAFHNAMERLYVYDPTGYMREKIKPVVMSIVYGIPYFFGQRELDFTEFISPHLPRGRQVFTLWSLAGVFSAFLTWLILIPLRTQSHYRSVTIRRGLSFLRRTRKYLVRRGYDPGKLATEVDHVVAAKSMSSDWGAKVDRIVDYYQRARYSSREFTSKDISEMRNAVKTAGRFP
ncbi:MAG: transglutaminaseTgpA domain-containing protein [bacterium]